MRVRVRLSLRKIALLAANSRPLTRWTASQRRQRLALRAARGEEEEGDPVGRLGTGRGGKWPPSAPEIIIPARHPRGCFRWKRNQVSPSSAVLYWCGAH
jgi:hypothetical protein